MSKKKTSPKPEKGWWLTRDNGAQSGYEVYKGERPEKTGRVYVSCNESFPIGDFLKDAFESLFDVRLRPGQCRKITGATMRFAAPKGK